MQGTKKRRRKETKPGGLGEARKRVHLLRWQQQKKRN